MSPPELRPSPSRRFHAPGASLRAGLAALALAPLAACATAPPGQVPARFDCDNGRRLDVTFDHVRNAAVLKIDKDRSVSLASRNPDSGMWYSGDGYDLRGAGDVLAFRAPDAAETRCVQTR